MFWSSQKGPPQTILDYLHKWCTFAPSFEAHSTPFSGAVLLRYLHSGIVKLYYSTTKGGGLPCRFNYFVSKRFYKKQQMQWTKKGAHLLIQVRAKVIKNELRGIFKKWYKDFDMNQSEQEKTLINNSSKTAA